MDDDLPPDLGAVAHGARVAHFDQVQAEAAVWADSLIRLRRQLCDGGFSPREAYGLSELWFAQHLEEELNTAMFSSDPDF
jgi:hypothetical protein